MGDEKKGRKTFTIPVMGLFRNFALLYVIASLLFLLSRQPPREFVYPFTCAAAVMVFLYFLVWKSDAWQSIAGMGEGAIWAVSIAVIFIIYFNINAEMFGHRIFLDLAPLTLATLSLSVADGLPISNALTTSALFYTLILLLVLYCVVMMSEKHRIYVKKQIKEFMFG